MRKDISNYLKTELNLKLKGNWQIFPVDKRGIDFLGYRFFHDYILLRKSTAKRFKQRIRQIKKKHRYLSPINILSGIMSYWGWMKYANCHRLQNKHIDSKIKKITKKTCLLNKLHNPLEQSHV